MAWPGLIRSQVSRKGAQLPCPLARAQWTVLALDLPSLVMGYTGLQYQAIKAITFTASMTVRGLFTSNEEYDSEVCRSRVRV